MVAFLPYLLPFLLLPLSLYLVSIIRKKGSDDDRKNLPPGSNGWPILGESMEFGKLGAEKFIKDRMKKHSPEVFQTSLLGEKNMAVFCGAQGNKFLFTNENKLVTSWWPESLRKALKFPESVQSGDTKPSKRTFHQDILKVEALKQYIPVMDAMAREHLDREWNPNSVVKVFSLSKKYTFDLACRLFLNVVDPVRINKLFDPFTLVSSNGTVTVPIDWPGSAYNQAIKGGKMAQQELIGIVKERRKEVMMENKESQGRDMLSKMVVTRDEDGQLLSEKEIASHIVGLLVATYEATSTSITAVINYLAQLPHIYNEVFKEQMEITKSKGPDDLLTWEDVEKMKYSWNVARESLRLMPPALGAFRKTTKEFTYAGFTIPKGWKTFWTVHSTHKNPEYFPEPEKFDPSRFEGSGPAPYTFVPFGGGPRMCPGKEYARLEVLVFMHNVVKRFKLEKAIPNEKIIFHAAPTPVYGVPVRIRPHQK